MALLLLLSLPLYWLPVLATPVVRSDSTSDSWQQYVRGPSNKIVYPARVLSNYTIGNVTNPEGLLQPHGSTVLSRAAPPTPPLWPTGTVANASSVHPPNSGDGQARTYDASNAIDGNVSTFWNDNTLAEYPDTLTIIAPSEIDLAGVTVLSDTDGVPVDFTVETLQNGTWSLAGTITGNSAVQIQVPFDQPVVSLTGIRINVTLDQALASGEFTRINEVYPGLVPDPAVAPTIVLDFGIDVVGFTSISFGGASSNHPGVRLAFSETTTYLTDICDFTRSDNVPTSIPASVSCMLIWPRAILSHLALINLLFLQSHLCGRIPTDASTETRSVQTACMASVISRSILMP